MVERLAFLPQRQILLEMPEEPVTPEGTSVLIMEEAEAVLAEPGQRRRVTQASRAAEPVPVELSGAQLTVRVVTALTRVEEQTPPQILAEAALGLHLAVALALLLLGILCHEAPH
jgi:hypothetical protein